MATKARQQYFADENSLQKQSREFSIADDLQQKIDSIEEGAQVNVIETVKVNGVALVPDVDKAVDVSVPGVIDSLSSTSIDDALSARQGKVLYDYIQSIGARGRFLSNWNCATGLPITDPEENPYPYKAGDYYSVSNVATSPATNYRPDGTQYVARQASTTVETETVGISDFYLYDGTTWLHLANSGRTIAIDSSLSTTSTNPVENRVITNALNSKADTTYVDAHDTVVSSTTPSNPTQGMLWYDTTNDVLKTYDGTSWTEVGVEGNTKTFYLSDTSDLTTAQAALDWYNDGKNPLIIYNNQCYIVRGVSPGHLYFGGQNAGGVQIDNIGYYNLVAQDVIELRSLSGVVQSIYVSLGNITGRFLDPTQNYTNPYIPLYPGSPATKKYVDDSISSIVIPTYTAGENISIDANNEISAIDTTYTAGEGIEIGTAQDYSAMRGPCPEGFHIPTYNEVLTLNSMCSTLGTTFSTHLFFPYNIHNIKNDGTQEDAIRSMYWTCEKSALDYYATVLHINSVAQQPSTSMMFCSCGIAIRPFKDVTKIPNSNWTTIFDGSNIADNAGVFYNSDLGILSISSDGINRITIADKNVGATQVYHDGDTLSDANRGLYYQFGNNYGFSWDGGYTTSSTKVNTTGYGPGNYYYDDVFITTGNNEWWSSVDNPDIWGGATGVVTLNNAIINTGVLSVNGQTGDVTIPTTGEGNTKTFYLFNTSDLVNAQAALDWYLAGKEPIIVYGQAGYSSYGYYYLEKVYSSFIGFRCDTSVVYNNGNSNSFLGYTNLNIEFSNGTVTRILSNSYSGEFLSTNHQNNTSWSPTQDYHPATKKYVDDKTPIVSATTPSSPTEGMLWYDTTNDILKTYDGTSWNVTSDFPGMTVLSYGHNTWQDFLDAYNRDAIVYCRASSQSNPGTGNQTRMAFMAFVDKNATTGVIQGVEFQYYRSRSDHNSAANQLDEVYVYKLTPADGGTWTVTQRNTGAKAVAGTGISLGWGSGNMTISADTSVLATKTDLNSKQDTLVSGTNIKTVNNESLLGSGNVAIPEYNAGAGIDITNNTVSAKAGVGLAIGNYVDYSVMRGPCPDGYHIPTGTEWNNLLGVLTTFGLSNNSDTLSTYLFVPQDSVKQARIRCCEWFKWLFANSGLVSVSVNTSQDSRSIRPFKDIAVMPDNSWTTLYDGSSTATGAGIFHNAIGGYISASSDGVNWITIADKHLGATTIYNLGDTLSAANVGNRYQRGNNYGVPYGSSTTTSTTKVDATGYGPGNYYSSSTFITGDINGSRMVDPQNENLWGGITGATTYTNTINNTGVLSLNGNTGDIILPNQVCVYNMPTVGGSMTDIISALTSGNSVLLNSGGTYYLVSYFDDSVGEIEAYSADGIGTVTFASITYSINQCSSLSYSTKEIIPSQSGNSGKFLTTNGTVASWGTAIGNDTTGTTTTVTKIWAGTQAEYNALQTYNADTIYHIY